MADSFTERDRLLGTAGVDTLGKKGFIQQVASSGSGTTADQVQGTAATGVAPVGNPLQIGGSKSGVMAPVLLDANSGYVQVTAGSTSAGGAGAGSLVYPYGNNGGSAPLAVVPQPLTVGGLSIARLVAATNGVIKSSAGQLYSGTLTNTNAAIRYLQIYNKATAGTLSTDTPALTIPLPPNVSVTVDFQSIGGAFATGISWQFTTDDVAIPTTAGTSTDIHGFVTYK